MFSRGNAYRDGKIHVVSEKCATCVFRPGNLMNLEPGRFQDLVEDNRAQDSAFSCHETTHRGIGESVCRGYYDAYGDQITPLFLAKAMRLIEETPPPTPAFIPPTKKDL